MWKDRQRMQKLKEKRDNHEEASRQAKQEACRRKKMSRAQDSVLKYMGKIMEVCQAQGFVYGIVPEKGKPVTGSSESLREWWKGFGFADKNSRIDHQFQCLYRPDHLQGSETSQETADGDSSDTSANSFPLHQLPFFSPDQLATTLVDNSTTDNILSVADWANSELSKVNTSSNQPAVTELGEKSGTKDAGYWRSSEIDELVMLDDIAFQSHHQVGQSSTQENMQGEGFTSVWDLKYDHWSDEDINS
ncbi:hypothetical protein Tsubulata_050036 [Turnera subulata]|uniref:Ethylene insensitive 3-like DNA-binding domain-containing protein n=1 Tax=Turnera subulata TaxID=218843 RepID=A0A9Q0G3V0_9ROSI|nr:hypothetical protein Tsubulata_050036 [Turnera subulata]